MKKLILGIVLLITIQITAQNFSRRYTSVISEKNYIKSDWQNTDVTVKFSYKKIIVCHSDGTLIKFTVTSSVIEGTTEDGSGYQALYAKDKDGSVAFQIFDDDTTLRIIIAPGYYIEYHRD